MNAFVELMTKAYLGWLFAAIPSPFAIAPSPIPPFSSSSASRFSGT